MNAATNIVNNRIYLRLWTLKVVFEGDSKQAVSALSKDSPCLEQLWPINWRLQGQAL
jgi:hypothetical protein